MQQMLKISVPTYCCETLSSHLVKSLTQAAKSVLIITLQAPSIASSTVTIDLWTVQALLTKGRENIELESLRIG
jgi:hypothetical protein